MQQGSGSAAPLSSHQRLRGAERVTLLTDLAAWFDDVKAEFILNFIDKNRWRMLLTGLGNTLLIALLACLIGIVLGVVVAILRTTWDNAGTGMRKGPARLVFALLNRLCLIYTTITPLSDVAKMM